MGQGKRIISPRTALVVTKRKERDLLCLSLAFDPQSTKPQTVDEILAGQGFSVTCLKEILDKCGGWDWDKISDKIWDYDVILFDLQTWNGYINEILHIARNHGKPCIFIVEPSYVLPENVREGLLVHLHNEIYVPVKHVESLCCTLDVINRLLDSPGPLNMLLQIMRMEPAARKTLQSLLAYIDGWHKEE